MAIASPNLAQASERQTQVRWYRTGFAMVALIVAARLLLHLLTANRYGIFRDELYYIACSRHLDWGYVDMPPFIPALTWLFHRRCSGLPCLSSASFRRSRAAGRSRSPGIRRTSSAGAASRWRCQPWPWRFLRCSSSTATCSGPTTSRRCSGWAVLRSSSASSRRAIRSCGCGSACWPASAC